MHTIPFITESFPSLQPLLVTPTSGQPPPAIRPALLNGLKIEAAAASNQELERNPKEEIDISPCCKYRKPFTVSLISVGLIMFITFVVLYWNYYETVHRRLTKKQGYILDHWGKGSPSAAETAVLDQEVEILKKEMEATRKLSKVPTNEVLSNYFLLQNFPIYQL